MLEKTYSELKDRAEFVFVYIREAHPADSNWGDGTGVRDPRTLAERSELAGTCSSKLSLSIPVVVDDMLDTVNMLYRAWPERIYVIDADGRIAHKSGIGPWGFDVDAARGALLRVLEKAR